ncbi:MULTISPECIES: peptide chain release factor N(5)-glutamine methyltransferase [Cyanophyceae]|uniref:peptide chain release factor N(5)-glutamine methyltransferase n=1 Tax=Cyanophyceae TaxID=3028117 RepID=UPI0016823117|nr:MULTISPECIES: peptide chain release factor N(5)-glutamine methyltransferase [Cyanophyceae]MBD1914883.1 peptide chain release factor N(5)-glutamine methyltransferase [Phormidium sp. FACHB-77]MBD2028561.1 peptide chain release factor N(5)-glutamine methyltransferase [Phormidium sp. FACHB-322]MBD2051795.1 peptide chain release factor N(5)-glutamine methyltransferase [Leptolyngbya sp. FACHB-60]
MAESDFISGAELWAWRNKALADAQVAKVDADEVDWLLMAVADVERLALRLGTVQQRATIPLCYSLAELERRWQQRLTDRTPVQYLVGETPWRDLMLTVSPAVLIPRPETELIIDLAEAAIARSPIGDQLAQGIWVDMGTGSGAIALGLAQTFPLAQILAVDFSVEALAIAQKNAARAGLSNRVTFYQGSWFEPLDAYRGQLSAVVSNPPYIPSALLPTLQPEVIHHEPVDALDGGDDGLDDLRLLAAQASDYLVPGGLWLVEMMAGQGEAVKALLEAQGCYRDIQICLDLAGRDRFVQAIYAPEP